MEYDKSNCCFLVLTKKTRILNITHRVHDCTLRNTIQHNSIQFPTGKVASSFIIQKKKLCMLDINGTDKIPIMELLVFATKTASEHLCNDECRGKKYICILSEKITFMSSSVRNIKETDPMVDKIPRVLNRIPKIGYDHHLCLGEKNVSVNDNYFIQEL